MTGITITRRRFVAGLAAGLPVVLAGGRIAGQTPSPLVAVTPEELLDTLEETPIRARYESERLEPVAWDDVADDGFEDAVGGVRVVFADDGDAIFGSYVVFEDERTARDAVAATENTHASEMTDSFPKTIEDHEGVFIEYERDGYHSLTLIPVRNVLVIGSDADAHHHRGRGRGRGHGRHRGEDRRSIGHAAVLVKHLLPILNRPT